MFVVNYSFRHSWKIISLVLIIISVCTFSGIWFFKSSERPLLIPNKLVEVETVTRNNLQRTIRVFGTIHPKHIAILVSKATGMLDALIPTGQKISKGTLIAKIDNPDIENNVKLSLRSEALAEAQFDRFKPLLKTGFISSKEVVEKKQALLDAQKELSKTKIDLDSLRFYAPFDGIIGAYKKREGAQVNQGEAVVSIYDPSTLVVDFDIPCSNLTTMNEVQSVFVFGKQYRLSHIQKMLDEESHMCPADVDIHCDDCLIGGTVPIDLVVAMKQDAIVIPSQAIFLRNSQSFVYLAVKNKVVMAAVKTGLEQNDKIEIIQGLKPGQQLIIKGQERLYPEMTVDIYHPTNLNHTNHTNHKTV